MPLEIRELIIKATVVQENAPGSAQENVTSNNGVTANEEMITTCIEKMIEIQKDKNER